MDYIIRNKAVVFIMTLIVSLFIINVINYKIQENSYSIISTEHRAKPINLKSKVKYKNGAYYVGQTVIVNKEYKLASDYTCFDNLTQYNEATSSFNKMVSDAKLQGIILQVSSRYRTYENQQQIYNSYKAKYNNVDRFSAKPGTSEHQTGLAYDIMAVDQSTRLKQSFGDTEEFKWLDKNAYKYGFILRYPKNKEDITGYKYEPWHYRYVGTKLSKILKEKNLTLEEYFNLE